LKSVRYSDEHLEVLEAQEHLWVLEAQGISRFLKNKSISG
jgi:hypothetical protein